MSPVFDFLILNKNRVYRHQVLLFILIPECTQSSDPRARSRHRPGARAPRVGAAPSRAPLGRPAALLLDRRRLPHRHLPPLPRQTHLQRVQV